MSLSRRHGIASLTGLFVSCLCGLLLASALFLLLPGGAHAASSTGRSAATTLAAPATGAVNLPARDACVALTNLSHGRAALVTFVSNGSQFVPQRMWRGKLASGQELIACGSFGSDGNTDVALVRDVGHRRCAITFYASNGARFTKAATWKGALNFATLALAVGEPPTMTHDGLFVLSRLAGGRSAIDLFQLKARKVTRQRLLTIKAVAAGSLMAVGDLNGDFLPEVAVLSPAGAHRAHLATFAYAHSTTKLEASLTWDGALSVKGGQLATGDINGDGRYELVSLTAAGSRGVLTSFAEANKTITAAPLALRTASPRRAKVGVADVTGDNRADAIVLTSAGKRAALTVYVSQTSGATRSVFWRGKVKGLAAARSPFGVAPTVPIRIQSGVKVLSAATTAALTAVSADGVTYTFSGAPAEITALRAGDVIVAAPGGAAPQGLLRTVVSVDSSAGQTQVTTSSASLSDVMASGQISANVKPNLAAARVLYRAPGVGKLTPVANKANLFTLPLNYSPCQYVKISGSLTLSADYNFNCDCSIHWHDGSWWPPYPPYPDGYNINDLSATSDIGQQLNVKASVSAVENYNYDTELCDWVVGTQVIWVYCFPIVLTEDVSLNLHVNASLKATLSVGVHESASYTLGLDYKSKGGFSLIHSGTASHSIDRPQFDVSADATVACPVVDVACQLYGAAGPFIGLGPDVTADINPQKDPWWTLDMGLEGDVGVKAEFLKAIDPDFSGEWDKSFTWPLEHWQASGGYSAPPPVVSAVSPDGGPPGGGSTVTITGSGLSFASGAMFGTNPAPNFMVDSDSQITCTSPPGRGAVDVTLATPGGISATSAADRFYYPAVIYEILPSTGPATGGTAVAIYGYGFTGATGVDFGSSPATNVVVVSDWNITCISPPGTGMTDVSVDSPGQRAWRRSRTPVVSGTGRTTGRRRRYHHDGGAALASAAPPPGSASASGRPPRSSWSLTRRSPA